MLIFKTRYAFMKMKKYFMKDKKLCLNLVLMEGGFHAVMRS